MRDLEGPRKHDSEQGHRSSAGRREGSDRTERSSKPTGHSSHAPLMSSVGGSSKQGHQHRNGRRGHERDSRREDRGTRNGALVQAQSDHEDYGRYGGRGPRRTHDERSTGRPRRDYDERMSRDEVPSHPGYGMNHHPPSRSRPEVSRRPSSGKFPADQTIQGTSRCACASIILYHSLEVC